MLKNTKRTYLVVEPHLDVIEVVITKGICLGSGRETEPFEQVILLNEVKGPVESCEE